jgi:trans-2,3-dihydro-3-hydroxyanthranilate isomerase
MRHLEFLTYDVFTERTFGGNPLGIFPDASGLSDAEMQSIARELNLSETVFLLAPRSGGTARVRIFTPGFEVPFAGHPTVGTACYLADAGLVELVDGRCEIVLEEVVGPVPVAIHREEGRPTFARLTPAERPTVLTCDLDRAALADIVRLDPDDLVATLEGREASAAFASVGLGYLVIPVADLDALARAALDDAARAELVPADALGRMIYVVAPAPGADADYRVRMFAPEAGVPEDPATGSAAGAFAGYLGQNLPEGLHRRILEQGVEVGRPSEIQIEIDVRQGVVDHVTVGGHAVPVTRGTLELPQEHFEC